MSYFNHFGEGAQKPIPFDMGNEPTSDTILEMTCQGSAVPLSEVKEYPHGATFDRCRDTVLPRDPLCTARLQLADPAMLAELAAVRGEDPVRRRGTDSDYPLLLICRRMMCSTNSLPRPEGVVPTGYNPLWMHPDDITKLALRQGEEVEIRSRHGKIPGFVEADDTMRPGVVGMTHGFGPRPGREYEPRRDGSNVNLLVSWHDDPDPHHGMPRMSALPVAVRSSRPAD